MIRGKPAFASLLILLSVLACQTVVPGRNAASTPGAVYLDLRNTWLTTKPDDLGIPYEPGSKVSCAILMDMGIDGDTATIASSIVGEGGAELPLQRYFDAEGLGTHVFAGGAAGYMA